MTAYVADEWWDIVTWGSVPDWLAAVGTIAAFLIAAITYRSSVRQGWKAQARRINIRDTTASISEPGTKIPLGKTTGVKMLMPTKLGELPTFAEAAVVAVVGVHNGSDEVIGPIKIEVIMEDASPGIAHTAYVRRTIQPGADFTFSLAFADRWSPMAPTFVSRITFRDAAGRWWNRTEGGPVMSASKDARFTFGSEAGRRLSEDELADAARKHNRSTFR